MRTCIKNVNQDWKNAVEGATGGNGPPLAFKALEQANTAGRGWRACRVRAQSGAVGPGATLGHLCESQSIGEDRLSLRLG